ncbi:MAG: hypothetical protein RBR08_08450 [Desulforegulaceae bacterium]|jgi:DNA-binding NtrC family response regulator|nr:hypothetical protein [Desulforegulaceae bacterium]
MKKIIVTDKSPHIRMLISREFDSFKCKIEKDLNQEEIIETSKSSNTFAIILDPEFITMNPLIFVKKINEISPETIVIIHAYDEWRDIFHQNKTLFFIEKNAQSIESVKNFVQKKALL